MIIAGFVTRVLDHLFSAASRASSVRCAGDRLSIRALPERARPVDPASDAGISRLLSMPTLWHDTGRSQNISYASMDVSGTLKHNGRYQPPRSIPAAEPRCEVLNRRNVNPLRGSADWRIARTR